MNFLESISKAFISMADWLCGAPQQRDNHPGKISQEDWRVYYDILSRCNGSVIKMKTNIYGTELDLEFMVFVHKDRTITVNGTNYPVAYVEESDDNVTVLYYERRYDADLHLPKIIYRRSRLSYVQYSKLKNNKK